MRHNPSSEKDFCFLQWEAPRQIARCKRRVLRELCSLFVVRLVRGVGPSPVFGLVAVADIKARLTKRAAGQMMAEDQHSRCQYGREATDR